MSEKEFCSRCNKPLVNMPCFACDGKGTIRKWLISKEDCLACSGSGIQFKCPDEFNHLIEDWEKKKQQRMHIAGVVPAIKQEYKSPQSRINFTINELTRRGTIPPPNWWRRRQGLPINVPPWDYRYPYPWHPNHPRNPNRFRRK